MPSDQPQRPEHTVSDDERRQGGETVDAYAARMIARMRSRLDRPTQPECHTPVAHSEPCPPRPPDNPTPPSPAMVTP